MLRYMLGALIFSTTLFAHDVFPGAATAERLVVHDRLMLLNTSKLYTQASDFDGGSCRHRGRVCGIVETLPEPLAAFTFQATTDTQTIEVPLQASRFESADVAALQVVSLSSSLVFKAPDDGTGRKVQRIGAIEDYSDESTYTFYEGDYYITSINVHTQAKHPRFTIRTEGNVRLFLRDASTVTVTALGNGTGATIRLNPTGHPSASLLIFAGDTLAFKTNGPIEANAFIYGYGDLTIEGASTSDLRGAVRAQGALTFGQTGTAQRVHLRYDAYALASADLSFDTVVSSSSQSVSSASLSSFASSDAISSASSTTSREMSSASVSSLSSEASSEASSLVSSEAVSSSETSSSEASSSASSVTSDVDTSNLPKRSFSYAYKDAIAADAMIERFDEERFCIITGIVHDLQGDPVPGVRIRLKSHGEYGSTLSDANGRYALAAEGGLAYTVTLEKAGYIPLHRYTKTRWNEISLLDTVQMTALDTRVTPIDLASGALQSHTATPYTDDRGTRSTTLIFNGVTGATATRADGTVQTLDQLNVRATEFATPKSMPALLPAQSAFTYCSELSADEVPFDATVTFDQPVVMLVDNFLGFETGEIVPVGYYDRNASAWKASDNGVVVTLLDTDGDGSVDALDATGDGQPDDLDGDGNIGSEVAGLSDTARFAPGRSFWRAEVRHFTPWDCNWPWGPPFGAQSPNVGPPTTNSGSCNGTGVCIPINGDCKDFCYTSCSVAGAQSTVNVSLPGTGVVSPAPSLFGETITKWEAEPTPEIAKSVTVKLEVAGRVFEQEFAPEYQGNVEFVWDGKDYKNAYVEGSVDANVRVGYNYEMVYYSSPQEFDKAFAEVGESTTLIRGRKDFTAWQNFKVRLERPKRSNGWSISGAHTLLDGSTLRRGDGTIETIREQAVPIIDTIAADAQTDMAVDSKENIYFVRNNQLIKRDRKGNETVYAGTGETGFGGDGGPATEAFFNRLYGIGIDPRDNIYIMDLNFRIRKIDALTGVITTVAGTGEVGYTGDGGPAIDAQLNYSQYTDRTSGLSHDIAFDQAGNLYFADYKNQRIRKITPSGIITTIAGNGTSGYAGDGGPATSASLYNPTDVAVDSQGNVYIADWYNDCVRKVDNEGVITTVAGGGTGNADGIPATQFKLVRPYGIDVDAEDNLLIADEYNSAIRMVKHDGTIMTLAGNGSHGDNGDGGLAVDATLDHPYDVTVGNNNEVYIPDSLNNKIKKISRPDEAKALKLETGEKFFKGRSEEAYVFDNDGKHLRTVDYLSGVELETLHYDENDNLIGFEDRFERELQINRNDDLVMSIVTPEGHVTEFTYNADKQMTSALYEDGTGYHFTYSADGLMTSMTDPSGETSTYEYNDKGERIGATDPELSETSYRFDVDADGTRITEILSELGDKVTTRDFKGGDDIRYLDTTYATGETESIIEDENNLRAQRTFAGMTTEITYTADAKSKQKRPKTITLKTPSGLSATTTVDQTYTEAADGSVESTTTTIAVNGKTTSQTRNVKTGETTITSPQGRQSVADYDPQSLLLMSAQSGNRAPVNYSYDDDGHLTQVEQAGRTIDYAYNTRGNVESVTDARNETTRYEYDALDRPLKITYPDVSTTDFRYDESGRMTKLTTPKQADFDTDYTKRGQVKSESDPFARTTTYAYDLDGKLTSIERPSCKKITTEYTRTRPTTITRPEKSVTISYDHASAPSTITTSDGESVSFAYDGTPPTQITYAGALNQSIAVGYNADMQPASLTYAGATQNVSYDDDGLVTQAGSATIARDAMNGDPKMITDNTYVLNRTFNSLGELDSETTTLNSQNVYGYEVTERYATGQIKTKAETTNGTTTIYGYAYDSTGRLTEVTTNGVTTESYTYDANGNRASATTQGETRPGTYTLDDQLEVYGDTTYRYDDDGYLIEKTTPEGQSTYVYGTLGELKSVTKPDGTVIEYRHNANNQRVAKKVNGTITEKYLWGDLTTLLAVYDQDDNLITRFEYADGRMPHKIRQNGQTYYLAYDQVGTPKAVIRNDGTIVKEVSYDTYGQVLSDSNASLIIPFGFAGGLYDPDTGLTRFGYRDYDAFTGKWTAKDPIGFAGGDSNLYGYVLNDPANLIDPTGKAWWLLAYAVFEIALSIYDAYDTASTIADPCTSLSQKLLAGGFFIVGALAPGGGYSQADDVVNLYRAVGPDELNDIIKSGVFKSPYGIETKYFTTSGQQASTYAQMAVMKFKDPPYTIIKTQIPKNALNDPLLNVTVEKGIKAYALPNNMLPGLKPTVLDYSPLP